MKMEMRWSSRGEVEWMQIVRKKEKKGTSRTTKDAKNSSVDTAGTVTACNLNGKERPYLDLATFLLVIPSSDMISDIASL